MESNRILIERHRREKPGTSFIAINGDIMSDRDDNRLWDMLWRKFHNRNKGKIVFENADYFHECGTLNYKFAREDARKALSRLADWYRVSDTARTAVLATSIH